MATISPRNRPVATYDPANNRTWGMSDYERRQAMPIGAYSNANPTGTASGRSTMDPGRLAGMISRGTARPGQVEAAKFAATMESQAEALKGNQVQRDYYQTKLDAERQGIAALRNAYEKAMNGGNGQAMLPGTPAASSAPNTTRPAATSTSDTAADWAAKLNPLGFGPTGIDVSSAPSPAASVVPTAAIPTSVTMPKTSTPPKKKPQTAADLAGQFSNPFGMVSTGISF